MPHMHEDKAIQCDLLILVATTSEREQLERAAKAADLHFQRGTHSRYGRYFSLGRIGDNRVHAVATEGMGPLGHGGSASKAILMKAATGATGLIQLGMAFGVDASLQNKGDVLVSTALIPYDNRDIVPARQPLEVFPMSDEPPAEVAASAANVVSAGALPYRVDYLTRVRWHGASPALLNALRNGHAGEHQVFFGAMLSGAARIFSSTFLRELTEGVPAGGDVIIGGDMEGVGLLASSPIDKPAWIVVKGISDFADEARHRGVDAEARESACFNSARFVLDALHHFKVR